MTDTFKKLFGKEAANYTKFREPYPDALFALLLEQIPADSSNILDLACGTGKSTEPLVEAGISESVAKG